MFPRCVGGESGKVLSQFVLVFSCFVVFVETPGAAQENKQAFTVALEPTKRTFRTPDDLVLRLAIINSAPPCKLVTIDPVLSPEPEEPRVRPFSVLELKLSHEKGGAVERKNLVAPDYTLLRPVDLLRIKCDRFFGWNIRLARGPWDYKLQSGRYRISGTLKLSLRSYAHRHRDFLEQFAQIMGLPPGYDPALLLAEGTFETQETTFEIEQDH